MTKLNKTEFVSQINGLKQATSAHGVLYTDIKITGGTIYGIRQSTKKEFKTKLDKLYEAYIDIEPQHLTTTALKPYVDRVQSPSLAILKAIEEKTNQYR